MKKNNNGNKRKKYSDAYIRYIKDGESSAVFIIWDKVDSINTDGKWVDILCMPTYNKCGERAFRFIVCELFERKLKPTYTDKMTPEDKKYETWLTAKEDIRKQRAKGIKGEKYLVLVNLYNANTKDFVWSKRFITKRMGGSAYATGIEKFKVYTKPDWRWQIQAVKQLSKKVANYIINNEDDIVNDIIENGGKPMLYMFERKS